MSWITTELKNVTVKIGSGSTPRGGAEAYKESGISLIRSQNILDLKFSEDGLAFIDDRQAESLKNVTVEENDVLLNITGDSVARCCGAPKNFLPARVNQHVAILRADKSKLNSDFLKYYLFDAKEQLLVFSEIGGTRNALTKNMLENFSICLPPLPEQQAIASVLSALDDKIDLLQRQNQTLEQMAATLFRQWFIEEAKEDWEEVTIGDIFTLKGGSTPSTKESSFWDGNISWTSPRDLSNSKSIFMFDTERKITEAGLAKISSGLLPKRTLLMSSRAPIGYLAITDIEVAINQGYIAIPEHQTYSTEFMYLWCQLNMDTIENAGNGSVFQEISKSSFKDLIFFVPDENTLAKFDAFVKPTFAKIKSNTQQIQTLKSQRDTLLPKLISGEVRLKGFETVS